MLDDSDYEDVGRAHDVNDSSSRHYWLGKLVFAQLLGEAVFSDASAHDSGDSLDVRYSNGTQKVCILTRMPGSSDEQDGNLSILVSEQASCGLTLSEHFVRRH